MPFVVATWNVNSVRARMHILIPWLEGVGPDVLCLQETKAQDHDFPVEAIEEAGYQAVYRGEKSYNGVAILSKTEIGETSFGFDDGGPADEARLLIAEVGGVTLINTYVPQGRELDHPMFAYKLEWFARLRALMKARFTPEDSLLWVGDLNVAPTQIDVWWGREKPDAEHVCYHPAVTQALEGVTGWGLSDVFRKHHPEPDQYTYYDYRARGGVESRKGWRIDHIQATRSLTDRSVASWIDLDPRRAEKPSDHTPLLASFDLS